MVMPTPGALAPLAPAVRSFDDGYRVLFERNPTPMWVFDLATHRFLAVNAAAVAEYGYPPEVFLTLTIRDVYAETELARFDSLSREAQELYTGLWVHRRRDGTSLHVEIRSNDLLFQGCAARLIHLTNVTARYQAEASRRESEQLLAALVESSDDAILSTTPDGTILTWNLAAERAYGYASAEAIGASIYTIVSSEAHPVLAATIGTICRGGRVAPYETTRVHKDGHEVVVSVATSPIVNRAGVVVGISSIARDIGHLRALEDQLRQAHKMEAVGLLAGGIAHDFNNLLTVISGNAELAMEQLDVTSQAWKDIDEIRLAGASATLLTRQLLTFSRKGIVEDSVVDLNDVVTHLDQILRRTAGDDVEFTVRQAADLWRVTADQGYIEQVVMNLVINARDAMPAGGALTVETGNAQLDESFVATHGGAAVGAFVKLSVTDTGCGMTPEVRARIFEPFFTSKGAGGTGLGLSTVFGIVQQAAGFMSVETALGVGSTFTMYLPRASGESAPAPQRIVPPVGVGTETILLVEDDNDVRLLSARGLRRHGYTLLLARHSAEAIKLVDGYGGKIDLLLTDIVMPGANGRALAERLSKSIGDLRVLYTSGYTDSVATLQAIRASSAAFIQKPYTPDSLARKVRSVLDARR